MVKGSCGIVQLFTITSVILVDLLLLLIVIKSTMCWPVQAGTMAGYDGDKANSAAAAAVVTSSAADRTSHQQEEDSARIENSANLSRLTGTSRKIRMFIRNHALQIFQDGTVNGTKDADSDFAILQRTSYSSGQVKIQGIATCMYLCMDSCGLLFGSRDFAEDCLFNEMIEQHHYNTYSSAKHSNDKRIVYIGLTKKGASRKVQVKTGDPLGPLSSCTKVLPHPVESERVEQLTTKILSQYPNTKNHHVRHHQICPPPHHLKVLSESQKCKRRKRRKKLQKCLEDKDAEDCNGLSVKGHSSNGTGAAVVAEKCAGGTQQDHAKKCTNGIAAASGKRKKASDTSGNKKKPPSLPQRSSNKSKSTTTTSTTTSTTESPVNSSTDQDEDVSATESPEDEAEEKDT